jgi:hypothetical protein
MKTTHHTSTHRTTPIVPSGSIHVHHGQAYVESGGPEPDIDMDATFRGQTQGLCGARVPGSLFLITGLHTGQVGFRIETRDREPPIDESYEDIVEASFRPASRHAALVEWGAEATYPFPLEPRNYRVRYSARWMDAGREEDSLLGGEPVVDWYLLEFWPAPRSPDRIVTQASEIAAYWHAYTQALARR